MKLIKIEAEHRPHIGDRRELRLKDLLLRSAAAIQVSELLLDRAEPYHTNQAGYVLCFVVVGWMEVHCAGRDHKLSEGEGIIFEPGERHRINKGEGRMISVSSVDYDELATQWEGQEGSEADL